MIRIWRRAQCAFTAAHWRKNSNCKNLWKRMVSSLGFSLGSNFVQAEVRLTSQRPINSAYGFSHQPLVLSNSRYCNYSEKPSNARRNSRHLKARTSEKLTRAAENRGTL